jgi:hypothetical protein
MRRTTLAVIGAAVLLPTAGVSTYALANGPSAHALTIALHGAQLSTGDYAFEAVSSLDGTGAAITHVTSSTPTKYPDIGTSVTTIYFPDGVSKQHVSFKQQAPNSNGISKFTGSGKCAGGTGIHKLERCSYTFTGTYNVKTSQNDLKLTGTDTR